MVTETVDFDTAFVGGFREYNSTIYPVVNTDSLSTFLGEFHSRQKCYHFRPSEEGRSRWLIVLRKTLSFFIPSRFIPALSALVFGFHVNDSRSSLDLWDEQGS